MGWSGRESRKQGRSGSGSGRGENGAGSGKLPLSRGASRQSQQAREDGSTVGMRRKLAHVADAFGQAHGRGPASKQALKPLGGLTARVVRVEGEEETRGQPRREAAAFSTPWVPRAAQAGMPHPAIASQSKTPSASTAHGGAKPSRPSPSTGLGPGSAWNLGAASGWTARPASHRTSPPATSGTTTIPANRSEPRSVNRPESLSRSAVKPQDSRASRRPSPGAKPRPSRKAASRPTPLEARYPLAELRRSRPA